MRLPSCEGGGCATSLSECASTFSHFLGHCVRRYCVRHTARDEKGDSTTTLHMCAKLLSLTIFCLLLHVLSCVENLSLEFPNAVLERMLSRCLASFYVTHARKLVCSLALRRTHRTAILFFAHAFAVNEPFAHNCVTAHILSYCVAEQVKGDRIGRRGLFKRRQLVGAQTLIRLTLPLFELFGNLPPTRAQEGVAYNVGVTVGVDVGVNRCQRGCPRG